MESTRPGVDSIVLVTFEKNVINMKCADCFFVFLKSMISAARGPLYQLTSTDIECFFLSISIYCQALFRVLSAGVLCTLWVAG